MSTVKNILAVVGDGAAGEAALATALQAGRYLDSHVDVLHVRPDPVSALPLVGEAMSGAMVDEMMTVAEREAGNRAKRARAVYDQCTTAASGVSSAWIEDTGIEEQVVAVRGCRADLIVLPRPIKENETSSLMTLNAALMQSGRAVLAAPPGGCRDVQSFKRVAVFWNGSTEATRAVAASLSFLMAAEQVTVLRVEEEEWFAPTEDLEAYLARHNVKTAVSKVLPKKGRTGEALLAGATESGAGMLVMGAYTRSKLRQLILGSVTGYVMQNAGLPVLLCH
jgi:nucleotide-binding universal stress UspA family protein